MSLPLDPHNYKFTTSQPFSDPAIMSARLASPVMAQPMHDSGYLGVQQSLESYQQQQQQQLAYGPPPGLAYPPGIMPGPQMTRHGLGVMSNMDAAQGVGSAHGELRFLHSQGRESQVRVPSAVLSVRKLYRP